MMPKIYTVSPQSFLSKNYKCSIDVSSTRSLNRHIDISETLKGHVDR